MKYTIVIFFFIAFLWFLSALGSATRKTYGNEE